MIKFGFVRYEDVEIYRMILDYHQSEKGHLYGGDKTKNKLDRLLKIIKNDENINNNRD